MKNIKKKIISIFTKKNNYLFIILSLLVPFSLVYAIADAYEPDNVYTSAASITVDGAIQNRTIDPVGDNDYVSFNAVNGYIYRITVNSVVGSTDLDFDIYDTDGISLLVSSASASNPEVYDFTALASGIYYVNIFDYLDDENADYEISILQIPQDSYEPDDTSAATTNTILVDGSIQNHNLIPIADTDYIKFDTQAGFDYTITAYTTSGSIDIDFDIYDTDGTTLLYSASSVFSPEVYTFTAPTTGTYYVNVFDFLNDETAEYEINIIEIGGDIYEPDNVYTSANIIPIDGTSQAHTIFPVGDEDWLKFNATIGLNYNISAIAVAGSLDIDFNIYDTDGTTLLSSVSTASNPESTVWTAPATGVYYIQVIDWMNDETSDYNISVKELIPLSADAYEVDNSSATANIISTYGIVQDHTIFNIGDNDWVKFSTQAGIEYKIIANSLLGPIDLDFDIYDTDGTTLLFSSASGLNPEIFNFTAPTTGTYYVNVFDFLNDEDTIYELSILDKSSIYFVAPTGNWSSTTSWSRNGCDSIADAGAVPLATDNVVICPGNTATVDSSGNAFNLTIDTGGTLNGGANTINVYGNFTNNGIFNGNTGTVTFTGPGPPRAILTDGAVNGSSFNNVIFDDAAGQWQLAGKLAATGSLTIKQGIFDTTVSNYAVNAGGSVNIGDGVGAANTAVFLANSSTITVGGS
ncbi:MAG: hypothetical protein OEZ13_08080, partial [Spirochaetia bacterium]|nr:hypothetical protein [Spirochaetia bacterium]